MLTYPITYDGRTFLPGGEVPAQPGPRLNCGHDAVPEGIAPGWYADGGGYTWCRADAQLIEAAEFAASDAYTAYLSLKLIVTGSGAVLAKVISQAASNLWTPTGGWYQRFDVRAVADDGSRWYGRSYSNTCLITLRRVKARQRVTTVRTELT